MTTLRETLKIINKQYWAPPGCVWFETEHIISKTWWNKSHFNIVNITNIIIKLLTLHINNSNMTNISKATSIADHMRPPLAKSLIL